MLRNSLFLFCLIVILSQCTHAQEPLKDYLGLSENELMYLKKTEAFHFGHSGKEYYFPSLIGDQSLWTKVDEKEIPSGICDITASWIDSVLKHDVWQDMEDNFRDGITGWRYYYGNTIVAVIKGPKEYKAGIAKLTWQHENEGNKFLVTPDGDGDTIEIWIRLNERQAEPTLKKENLEHFSKNILKTFFNLPEEAVDSLRYQAGNDKNVFLCCDLQETFDMDTRPKVRSNNQEYPKAFTWFEHFKIATNGKVVRVSVPSIQEHEERPAGVGFHQQPRSQSMPAF